MCLLGMVFSREIFFFNHLFILIWLHWVLVAACGI